jgi:hypothetical protein
MAVRVLTEVWRGVGIALTSYTSCWRRGGGLKSALPLSNMCNSRCTFGIGEGGKKRVMGQGNEGQLFLHFSYHMVSLSWCCSCSQFGGSVERPPEMEHAKDHIQDWAASDVTILLPCQGRPQPAAAVRGGETPKPRWPQSWAPVGSPPWMRRSLCHWQLVSDPTVFCPPQMPVRAQCDGNVGG